MRKRPSKETDHLMVELAPDTWIDEGIAPLIAALWDQGYTTTWSCQGGTAHTTPAGNTYYDQAYISFLSFDDGARFMRHVWQQLRPTGEDSDRDLYVHPGVFHLEIGDNYWGDKIVMSMGPSGCVRFPTELGGWNIMEIVTEVFTKEKESSKA